MPWFSPAREIVEPACPECGSPLGVLLLDVAGFSHVFQCERCEIAFQTGPTWPRADIPPPVTEPRTK